LYRRRRLRRLPRLADYGWVLLAVDSFAPIPRKRSDAAKYLYASRMTTGVRNVLGRNLIGLSAPRALTALLRSLEDVAEVYLAELRPLPPLQDRFDLTAAEHTVLKSALKHRSHKGLSFWDAVLLELPGMPEAIRLIDAAMMHVSLRGQKRPLSRSLVVAGALERACEEYLTTRGVSLTFLSEVRCRDGSLRHLPMLDFHAFASDSNRLLIEA
jgi:hypothetical protein